MKGNNTFQGAGVQSRSTLFFCRCARCTAQREQETRAVAELAEGLLMERDSKSIGFRVCFVRVPSTCCGGQSRVQTCLQPPGVPFCVCIPFSLLLHITYGIYVQGGPALAPHKPVSAKGYSRLYVPTLRVASCAAIGDTCTQSRVHSVQRTNGIFRTLNISR